MAGLFGMQNTADWSDPDYRPLNYMEVAFKLWPTSPTPLTYLTSKLPSRTTDDPEYKIYEWRLPQMVWAITVVSADDPGATQHVITVAASQAYGIKVGDLLEVEGTSQQYIVITASANGTTFGIQEWNTTIHPAVADNLRWVGSAYAEGSGAPESIVRQHSLVTNYTQIFKDSVEITGTAEQTRIRPNKPWPQMKAECLERFMLKHEYGLLRGAKKEDVTGTNPIRTMGGLEEFITETKDWNGSVALDTLEDQLQIAFKYGSKDKALVLGNTAIKILNRVARNHAALNFDLSDKVNKDQTFGLDVTTWVCPFGVLRLIPHNLMSESDVYTNDGYVLDMKYLERVKMRNRDIKWFPNAADNDQDGKKGYYQGELGFSLALPEVHQKWTEMSGYAPDA
ncbi:MAG: DUF5309 family protein [Gammaproteobacteria bacterium]|nr:DUF5309 family protein [Gammaproteobacteria bacterium]